MISQEEYLELYNEREERERQRVARKVLPKKSFTMFALCPKCKGPIHRDYNDKWCGHCATPLDWSKDE